MQYTEPWGGWRSFGLNPTEPSYVEKIATLQEDYVKGTGKWWITSYWGAATTETVAETVLNTAPYDKTGNHWMDHYTLWQTWGDDWLQNYPTNPDPDIPSPNRYDISHAKYLQSTESGIYEHEWTFGPHSAIDTIAHSGDYSGKIEIYGTSDVDVPGIRTRSYIPASPSTEHNFSVWGKTLNFGGTWTPCVRVQEYSSDETYITQTSVCFASGTHDWTRHDALITTTSDTAYVEIVANCWGGYGTFWFDDVELCETGSVVNLVKSGGFESAYDLSNYGSCGYSIDSLMSDYSWPTFENYRRDHWKYTDYPLVFSYDTKQPVIIGAISQHDYLVPMHENMTAINKRVDANIFRYAYSFYGHLIDVLGSEVWDLQMDDTEASLRRTMSHHKTNRNLLLWSEHGDDSIAREEMKTYLNDQMFYGMFPSVGSASPSGRYWNNATLYERDRDMFKKYIPIIKTISAAGWEPIPYATCDNPDMLFERYGDPSEGLYYTVASHNSTIDGVLSIDMLKLGFDGTVVEVTDLVTNTTYIQNIEDGKVLVTILELYPRDTRVYKISL